MTAKDLNPALDQRLGEEAKRIRETLGLTLRAAAEVIRDRTGAPMNFATLWEHETGAYRWNTKNMVIIARGYELPDDYFLTFQRPADESDFDHAWATGGAAAVLAAMVERGQKPSDLLILLGSLLKRNE